jgi:hypothetical protein
MVWHLPQIGLWSILFVTLVGLRLFEFLTPPIFVSFKVLRLMPFLIHHHASGAILTPSLLFLCLYSFLPLHCPVTSFCDQTGIAFSPTNTGGGFDGKQPFPHHYLSYIIPNLMVDYTDTPMYAGLSLSTNPTI